MQSRVLWLCLGAMLVGSGAQAQSDVPGAVKWAIVIGVQQYLPRSGFASLQYAETDALRFSNLLTDPDRGGYDARHVQLLTTAEGMEWWPGKNNIVAALDNIAKWAQADPGNPPDTVLLYFSGHGIEQGGKSYLIPADASGNLAETAISLDSLREKMAASRAKKQIIILDACRLETFQGKAGGGIQSVEFARALEAFRKAEGSVVLASCQAGQASYEDDQRHRSAFTGILLDGLMGLADANHDGLITLNEGQEYVARELRIWAETHNKVQLPTILYGEVTLTLPLVRCPKWAEMRISSVPDEAEIWIDGENTGHKTPHTLKLPVSSGQARTLAVRLKKEGYEDLTRDVTLQADEEKPLLVGLKEVSTPVGREERASLRAARPAPWDVAPLWRERAEEEERRKDKELRLLWSGVGYTYRIDWDGSEHWGHEMNAQASDPLGIANIEAITVTDPAGKVHRAPGDYEWHQETDSQMWVVYGEWFSTPPRFAGVYTFTVTNRQGKSVSESVALPAFVSAPVATVTYPPNQGVLEETVPTFFWEPVREPAFLAGIYLKEKKGENWEDVWELGGPGTWEMFRDRTSIVYNWDGKASQPELIRGRTYKLILGMMMHLGEHAGAESSREIIFTVAPGPDAPRLYDCGVEWLHSVEWDGSESWGHRLRVGFNDALGPDNVQTVSITDPTGRVYCIPGCDYHIMSENERGRKVACEDHFDSPPAFSGVYAFVATNWQGASSVVQHVRVPAFSDEFAPIITSPSSGAVVRETAPLFSWDPIAEPGWINRIIVAEVIAGARERIWTVHEPFGKGQAWLSLAHNFDGTASQPELIPGHTYEVGVQVHHYFSGGVGVEAWSWVRFSVAAREE